MGESLDNLDGFEQLSDMMMKSYLLMVAAQVSKEKHNPLPDALASYPELDTLIAKSFPDYDQMLIQQNA